ncbi:MAG TPA: recombinase family protein, partial [Actinomycetes bacterium]
MEPRSILYARQSADRPRGIKRQIEDGLRVFDRKNWPRPAPEDILSDNDLSASRFGKKPRKDYLRLLEMIDAGKCDGARIVMAVEDRTHRQVLELAEFIDLCRKHKITVATEGTEYDLSDPDQVTMWFIKVRFAEAEVEKISKRVRRARLQEAEKGEIHPGGKRAYGERGRLRLAELPDGTVKPAAELTEEDREKRLTYRTVPAVSAAQATRERKVIRMAADHVVGGEHLRVIVRGWNKRGVTGAGGEQWTTRSLRRMLLSPRLAGLREHNGAVVTDKETGEPVKVTDDPILPFELWQKVKAKLEDPARRHTAAGAAPRHLLTGLVFCGVCKTKLRADRDRDGHAVYVCPPSSDGGHRCVTRRAELVERLIERALFRAVESPEWEERAAERPADDPARPHLERVAELTAELDVLDRRIGEAELAEELARKDKTGKRRPPHP